ncbi:MAG: ECF-type sigma factor [Phycisphaerales bacterium]|nr:ECF-type sigma factor [Phycisphaerales bacterium]
MSETIIEQLLVEVRDGHEGADARLFEAVYAEMRRIAGSCFRGVRADHTLTPTAVVHEAWMRLSGNSAPNWEDRRHFYASAAQAMRHVLIDHARSRGAVKRGGGRVRVPIDANDLAETADSRQIIALDDAVKRLEEWNPELGEVVRLRFYAGLTSEQASEVMGLTLRTFKRRWSLARGWLERDLVGDLERPGQDDE